MDRAELRPLGHVEVSTESGFCFGVVTAISKAEQALGNPHEGTLYCLGDIVHNRGEVKRLEQMGMKTIDDAQYRSLSDARVFFRAHGEPPASYRYAEQHNIKVIDATCPVVLQLQQRVRRAYLEHRSDGTQIVIFGKPGHAEVNGLVGQTDGSAIVIRQPEDVERLNFDRPIILFSQTTMQEEELTHIESLLKQRMAPGVTLLTYDTICKQVSKRIPQLKSFAASHDRVFFVAGRKSSNGRVLYDHCLTANPQTHFISEISELVYDLVPDHSESIGVCGATSTSQRQLQEVARQIESWMQRRFAEASQQNNLS